MIDTEQKLIEALNYINPDDYDTWLKVGMALKHEGVPFSVWDNWSRQSSKYHEGECFAKWKSFNERNSGQPVTGGTLLMMAKQNGFTPGKQTFDRVPYSIRSAKQEPDNSPTQNIETLPANYKPEKIPDFPANYDPARDMQQYLRILFQSEENVCYCDRLTQQQGKDGKARFVPLQSVKDRTAGQIIKALDTGIENAGICFQSEGGAFIRFNPMDGKGDGDANVTDFRFCLIESDTDTLEKQYGLYKALNLPIAALIHSGNKSLHAITHVDAQNIDEYRERVRFIYDYCKKHGLHVDEQDKNASRYSRLPGIKRGDNWQYIVAAHMGAKDFSEWKASLTAQEAQHETAGEIDAEALDSLVNEADGGTLTEYRKQAADVTQLVFPPLSLERSRALRQRLGDGRNLKIPFWIPEYKPKPSAATYTQCEDWIKYHNIADTVRFDGMNIIGARTGGGKTTFMISLAAWILHRDPQSRAVYIALEENEEIITEKLLSAFLFFEDTKAINTTIGANNGYGREPDPRDYEITLKQIIAFCSGKKDHGLTDEQRRHIERVYENIASRLIIIDPPKLDEARAALIASKEGLTAEQQKDILLDQLSLDQSDVLKAIIKSYRADKADTVFFIDYAQLIHNEKSEATKTGSNVLELKAAMRDLMREAADGALIYLAAQMNRTGAQTYSNDPCAEFNFAIPENLGESSGIERNAFKVIYCTIYNHRDNDIDKKDYLNVSIIKHRGGVQRIAFAAPMSWKAQTVNLYACTWPKFMEEEPRPELHYTQKGEPIYGKDDIDDAGDDPAAQTEQTAPSTPATKTDEAGRPYEAAASYAEAYYGPMGGATAGNSAPQKPFKPTRRKI